MNEIFTGLVCLICLGKLCTLSIRRFLEIRRQKGKSKGRETFFSLLPPPPPDSKTSSPLTPKEGLFLRLDALCWVSLIVAYSPRSGSLDCQSLQNFRLWCCPNTVLCVHYHKLYSTVAHRDKTLPRIQNTSRIQKHIPKSKNVLDSGKYFGFLEVFLDSGTCFVLTSHRSIPERRCSLKFCNTFRLNSDLLLTCSSLTFQTFLEFLSSHTVDVSLKEAVNQRIHTLLVSL